VASAFNLALMPADGPETLRRSLCVKGLRTQCPYDISNHGQPFDCKKKERPNGHEFVSG
jgi:hypothetical protein